MVTSTHTDATPDTQGRTQRPADGGTIRLRNLPDQWLLIEVDPPAAGLNNLRVRLRGRVLTIDATRPWTTDDIDERLGVQQCTTRIVLSDRPRGSIRAWRDGESLGIRVPLHREGDIRAIDGMAGVAAAGLARARLSAVTQELLPGGGPPPVADSLRESTRDSVQEPDVAP